MEQHYIERKLLRLRRGATPRVLDLFAGCGGLSLGFQLAGFEIAGAVEFDKDAADSHGRNFHNGDPRHCQPIDITQTSPEVLSSTLRLGPMKEAVDVIVGGPPCQAFARVGRSKLREVDEHPEAFMHDPRARLYTKYLEYVDSFEPVAVVMENVPDMLNHGGQNLAEEMCEVLARRGYVAKYTLLNAAFFGVPQMRERMFLVAYHKELSAEVRFPRAKNWVALPPGYEGSRAVALKTLRVANMAHHFISAPIAASTLPPAITAEEAIGDLPEINARRLLREGHLRRGARRLDTPIPYDPKKPLSAYVTQMKCWPGHEAPESGLKDHVIRYLPRDYDLFAKLSPGDQYPEAHKKAVGIFNYRLQELRATGVTLRPGTRAYNELQSSIVPPYDPTKFPNKWRKMSRVEPARTLMAHLGKDSYSHIHYDSRQARTISVREAARLQSFPDGFKFSGTMNPAFRQIGNAVPPLLAAAVASEVLLTLHRSLGQLSTQPTTYPHLAAG